MLTGLTRTDLVSGTFEVEVRATRGSGGPSFTARLDAVTVSVEYTTGTRTFTFDNNGNQTAAGPTTYTYDYADRLKTAAVGGTTETYTYAGDGVRLTASTGVAPNQTTKSLWDRSFGLPQLVIERDGSDTVLRSYRYGSDLVNQSAGGNTYYYHHDGLGSVVDVTGTTGTSLAWNEFYPYGSVRTAGVGVGAPTNPFNFTGEQLDGLTGLYHLRARQYDTGTGRFLSLDPLPPLQSDPYVASYVGMRNNPVLLTDPSGKAVFLLPLIGVAIVGAAIGIGAYITGGVVVNELNERKATEGLNFNDAVLSGAAGAVTGGASGFWPLTQVAIGMAAGVASSLLSQTLNKRPINPCEYPLAAAFGAVGAFVPGGQSAIGIFRALIGGGLLSAGQSGISESSPCAGQGK